MSLWIKNLIFGRNRSPQICTQTSNICYKGTFFITCRRASLTLEAAIVIPLMIGFLAIILFFFRVIQVQSIVEEALIYAGREVAVESSVISSEQVLFLSAEEHLSEALINRGIEDYIENGIIGISLWESNFEGTDIVLRAKYRMKLPVAFFEINTIELSSENHFQKWVGNEGTAGDENWVYVTEKGTVYHASTSCRVLDLSIQRVSFKEIEQLRGASGQKYYACGRCVEKNIKEEAVYCTGYGRLYHQDINCSFLKRSVKKVLVTEVQGKKACSYCYNEGES